MNQRLCTFLAVGTALVLSASANGQTTAFSSHNAGSASVQKEADQAAGQPAYWLETFGPGQYQGKNAAQRLTFEFDPLEARLTHSRDTFGLRLTGYGYGDRLRKPLEANLAGADNRLEYRRGQLTEWYENRPDGLEQGFTFAERPGTARAGEPLVITLQVTGNLQPALSTQGDAVLLRSEGNDGFRYGGLRSWDARGREVASRLEVRDHQIRLIVEDRDAAYPLVVDPSAAATTFVPAPGSPDAVGTNPMGVVVADFDHDTNQDIAVPNQGGFISILSGNGTGAFSGSSATAGAAPRAIAMADFNGDNWADLVVVNTYAGISVLINRQNACGTPCFAIPVGYTAHATPEAVAVGDFNGDLKPDIVVSNNGSNDVSVLINNGNGTFGGATNYPVGLGPSGVAVGNFFTGDPNLDIVVINSGEGSFSILKGNGAGAFSLFTTVPLGSFGRTLNGSAVVVVGDFDKNGNQDIAIAGDLGVVVLLGHGDGTFDSPVVYAAHSNPSGLAIGDFNGDTIPDLAVSNAFSKDVSVLIGNGNGTFGAPTNYPAGQFPVAVAVGDFNNDTKADLAVANFGDNNITVLLGILWNITALSGTPQATNLNKPFPLPLIAEVRNGDTNALVNGAVVTFTAPDPTLGASAILSPAGPQSTVAGDVQVSATANGFAGSYFVNATLGFAGIASFSLINNPGDPSIAVYSGTPQTASINTAFSNLLKAKVIDAGGNGVAGIPVTFTAPSGSSVASGTFTGGATSITVNTDSNGIATALPFTANGTAGSYNVTASSSAPGVLGIGYFALTNAGPPPAPPAAIAAFSGTPQSASVNSQFSGALIAKVTDSGGNPVAGASVTFTAVAAASGASASIGGGASATVQTDATGRAAAPAVLANSVTGTYSVKASLSAFPAIAPAVFSLTNSAVTLLPASLSIRATYTAMVPLNLGSPAASSMIITIVSSNPSIVSVSTSSILIPAGSSTGNSSVRLNGLKAGTATVTACRSANGKDCSSWIGFAPVSMLVTVTP